MLTVTALGHQGWLIQCRGESILIDPLLDATFGKLPSSNLRVWPPRNISHQNFPAITAVFFTHEHEDHFQVVSLLRLDRKIPLILSSKMSSAAFLIAQYLGFKVHRLEAEKAVAFEKIELKGLLVDYRHFDCFDEWDVQPFQVRDRISGEVFQSTVDLPRNRVGTDGRELPWGQTYANNFTSNHCLKSWGRPPTPLTPLLELSTWLNRLAEVSTCPRAIVLSGGGWSFAGELAWLNGCFFPADNKMLARAMDGYLGKAFFRVVALEPGDSLLLQNGSHPVVEAATCDFIRTQAQELWPDRTYDPTIKSKSDVAPLLVPFDLNSADEVELAELLSVFARSLLGSSLFLTLNSLSEKELGGKRRGYALFLKTDKDGSGFLFSYDPSKATFSLAESEVQAYLCGGVCWARDMLGFLKGEISAALLCMGHFAEWLTQSMSPTGLSLEQAFWMFGSPLRAAEQALCQYRRIADGLDRSLEQVPSSAQHST